MAEESPPRSSRRMPLERQVRLTFERFTGFVDEISSNISLGGMFVRSTSPPPPGTQLTFEFSLADGFQLIRGTGEVMWARPEDLGPDQPAGLGIRFLSLDPGSEELIIRVMEEFLEGGGVPFDLERAGAVTAGTPPELPSPTGQSAAAPGPPRSVRGAGVAGSGAYRPRGRAAAVRRSSNAWLIRGVIAAAALALTGVGYLLVLREEQPAAGSPVFGPSRPGKVITAASMIPTTSSSATLAARDGSGVAEPQATPVGAVATDPSPGGRNPGGRSSGPRERSSGNPVDTAATAGLSSAPEDEDLTIIESISWEEGPGWTEVTIEGDGPIIPASYNRLRLDDPTARELIRFKRIVRPFPEGRIPVASPQLLQVRVGYHEKAEGNELHLVFDLTEPGVRIGRVSREGHRMRIRLEG